MAFLRGLVRIIDAINEHVGRATAWLMVLMVLIAFVVVLLRYVYGLGWVALQESFVWLHGTVFMMGAAYTLLHDGHVRVDVFYRPASARTKAMINLLGTLFLLMPMILVVLYYSQGFVTRSWDRFEGSSEAGGLPGLFLLKTVIPAFCVLMLLQGVSLIGRSLLVLKGDMRYASSQDDSHEVA